MIPFPSLLPRKQNKKTQTRQNFGSQISCTIRKISNREEHHHKEKFLHQRGNSFRVWRRRAHPTVLRFGVLWMKLDETHFVGFSFPCNFGWGCFRKAAFMMVTVNSFRARRRRRESSSNNFRVWSPFGWSQMKSLLLGFSLFFPGWGCFRKGGIMIGLRVWRRRRRRRVVHPAVLGFGVPSKEVGWSWMKFLYLVVEVFFFLEGCFRKVGLLWSFRYPKQF